MYEELFQAQGLSLERLHALVQLAENGSLIRAAKGEAGRQSRLSHYIRELSSYFGVELTERVGKTIRLTAAGEELVRRTRDQFDSLLAFKKGIQGSAPIYRLGAGDSLLQWLVIPSLGMLRRPQQNPGFELQNLRTQDINTRLQDQRLDFGLVRADAVAKGLKNKKVCTVRYIIVVPDRIGVRRGMLTLKHALLGCPHAALSSDGSMRSSIDKIAGELGGKFAPELRCESLSVCVAAVRTGHFAAVLPVWAWDTQSDVPHSIFEDPRLDQLERSLVLAWHPRLMETHGTRAGEIAEALVESLATCNAG